MKPQSSPASVSAIDTVAELSHEKEKEIDSFYTTKCVWPKWLGDANNPKESLMQDKEIMDKYKDCYIRHNGLIEVLKDGD